MRLRTVIALLMLSYPVNQSVAGSVYSSRGIGTVHYFVSGRAQGMGGVGLSVMDALTVNYLNPATLATVPWTTVTGNVLHESTGLETELQKGSILDTNVFGFQMVIPLKQNIASICLGISPYSTIDFTFVGETEDVAETVSGEGGLNTASFSLAIRPFKQLYLGATGLYYFGVLRNQWEVAFTDESLLDTRDEITTNLTSGGLRFGMLLNILPSFKVAAVMSPKVQLNASQAATIRGSGQFDDLTARDLELPVAYGFGASLQITRKLLLASDLYIQEWSDSGISEVPNNSMRIGGGLEYAGNGEATDSFFKRSAIRIGAYYRDTGIEAPAGAHVQEYFGTLGLSIPIKWGGARIDMALQAGRRGALPENTLQETVVRFTATVSVGQRWFQRGRGR